jgi:hypothetical protein
VLFNSILKGNSFDIVYALADSKQTIKHSGISGGIFRGGGEGRPFYGEREGGTPFFSQEKENIDILGNFEHFVAQKVHKYSKIAQDTLLGSFLAT